MTGDITIPLDNKTKRFYQGASAAGRVVEEHAHVDFPDQQTRVSLFWFYVGALAAAPDEFGCTTSEDFDNFLLGASTRAPKVDDDLD